MYFEDSATVQCALSSSRCASGTEKPKRKSSRRKLKSSLSNPELRNGTKGHTDRCSYRILCGEREDTPKAQSLRSIDIKNQQQKDKDELAEAVQQLLLQGGNRGSLSFSETSAASSSPDGPVYNEDDLVDIVSQLMGPSKTVANSAGNSNGASLKDRVKVEAIGRQISVDRVSPSSNKRSGSFREKLKRSLSLQKKLTSFFRGPDMSNLPKDSFHLYIDDGELTLKLNGPEPNTNTNRGEGVVVD